MPMPDPFENVMTMLRNKGSVDPNTSAARSASIKDQRRTVGATPPARKKPPQTGGSGMPQGGMPQQGAPEAQGQPDLMQPIVNSLNEAIVGLKAQIHRAPDPEQRRMLEQQAQHIRQRVVEMGGEPVWADESIEEGMRKIKGGGMPPEQGGMPGMQGGMPPEQGMAQGQGVPEWVDQHDQQFEDRQRPDWTQLNLQQAPQEKPPQNGEGDDHFGPWKKRQQMKERLRAMKQQRQEGEE